MTTETVPDVVDVDSVMDYVLCYCSDDCPTYDVE